MSDPLPEFKEKLEPYQIDIYKGLKTLGEDIADFYLDGVRIFNSGDLRTKSNLLGHCAREIDSGLRGILSPKKEKKITQKTLKITQADLKKKLGSKEKDKVKKGNVASILTALNCDLDSEIAVEWINVANKFHKYAHRDGKRRKIRDPSVGEELWKRYEQILLWLIGTTYNFLNRIDRILSYEEPSNEILDSLDRLFEDKNLYEYFFTNLKYPKWLKHLKDRGYFNLNKIPDRYELPDSPGSYTNPPWMPLWYLRNIAVINKEAPNRSITNLIIEIVNSIIENYDDIDNSWIGSVILDIISKIPSEKIDDKHIEIIRTILRSPNRIMHTTEFDIGEYILPALINGQRCDLIFHLLDIIFDFNIKGHQPLPIVDEHWLNETLKKYRDSIFKLCGIGTANVILEKLRKVTNSNPNFSISAIDDNQQNLLLHYDCIIVHFLRDIYESADPRDVKVLITDLLKEDAPIFKKLAIHLINYHYSELKNLFWELPTNPLNNDWRLRHEIYILLKNHFLSFNDDEVEKLINWIEDYDYHVPEEYEDNDEEKEIAEAYEKLRWLDAVKGSENTKIKQTYLKYKKKYPEEMEHPDFDIWSGRLRGIEKSCPEELYKKSNQKIAEYLNDHEQKEVHLIDDSRISIKECIKNNPAKFTQNLEPFLNVSRINQHELLDGLLETLRDKKDFEWNEILDFIESIIDDGAFWKEEYSRFNYRDWIIARIADIVETKTRNDDNPFKTGLLSQVSRILIKLAENTDSELYQMEDIVTSVLNSPKGKIYIAMINFLLSYARLYKKDDEEKWYVSIKLCIEKELDNPSLEFLVVLAEYLRFIYYIDKNWVIENIDKIFGDKYWEETFSGYLIYHTNPIYEEIYNLVKEKGYYDKAIDTNFNDKKVSESLVYQICSAYLFGYENLTDNDGLILKLIQKDDPIQLSEIVRFFLMQKKGNYKIAKPKIKPLWKILFDLVSKNPDNFHEFIDQLSRWLVFFDEIDQELFEWLMFSAKYIKRLNFFIVKNLLNCIEKSPKEVATIFIDILNNGTYPEYKKEDIIKIVEILYEKGEKESADKICNLYGGNNIHFLRPLYDQHNKLR